jgi:hypothetical protein
MTEAAGTAQPGGDDPTKWWDELLEDVASLASEVTDGSTKGTRKASWGRNKERLAGILSVSDPSLASAVQMGEASASATTAPPSATPAADVSTPRPPETVPPPPPTQFERGAPAIRPRRPEQAAASPAILPPAAAPRAVEPQPTAAQAPPAIAPPGPPPATPAPPTVVPPPPAPAMQAPTTSPPPIASPQEAPATFVPAAPGTVIELPEQVQPVVAPWETGPGYVPPSQQTVQTDMPTIGIPVAPGFVETMTNRGYRPQGARLHARVRILWERLITRQREEQLVAEALVTGMVAGAIIILTLIFVFRLFYQ